MGGFFLQPCPALVRFKSMSEKVIEILSDKLKAPLPGPVAQQKMSAIGRKIMASPPSNARVAAVLALFYPKPDDWHLVLIERASRNLRDRHKGQISFPGGRVEPEDQSLSDTALRETEEEVGVKADTVELLGSLTELYIPVSNYNVNPYVGYTEYTPKFIPEVSEVAGILEVPVSTLINPDTVKKTMVSDENGIRLKNVPYFDVNGKIVWGATAMMLSELLEVIKS